MEFALCVPVTFLLFASVVDGARLMAAQHVLARATRDAARVGSMINEPPPATGVEIEAEAEAAAVRSMEAAGFATTQFSVESEWLVDGQGFAWIRVEITADFDAAFDTLSPFYGPIRHEFSMLSQEQ